MKFTLSLDTELGVGPNKRLVYALHEREIIPKLIDLFDTYETPVTWSIVGHLFLSNCDGCDLPFNDCTDPKWKNALYGPDLIEMILSSSTKPEIASHSFAHINYANEPLNVIEKDVRAALIAMKNFNIDSKTFIFPWNAFNTKSLEIVKGYGFNFTRTSFDFKDYTYPLTSVPSLIEIDESTPINYVLKLVDLLKNDDVVFHVWTHPVRWKNLHKLEKLLFKIKREEIPIIRMRDGYNFDLISKKFIYAHLSRTRVTYSQIKLGFRIYYSNCTSENVMVKMDLFHRLLCKMQKPTFHSLYHKEEIKVMDGKLFLPKKSIGQGLMCYTVPKVLNSSIRTLYKIFINLRDKVFS